MERTPNVRLKTAIFEAGLTQRDLARKTRIPESYISLAIHGKFLFDALQKAKISSALGVSEKQLFSE